MPEDRFIIRDFKETDRGYICSCILNGIWALDSATRRNNKDSFLVGHNIIINSILSRSKCLVVADPLEPKLIYGFIIFEQGKGNFDILHYAYLRKDFRKLGLLKSLVSVIKTKDYLSISHINDEIKPARLKEYWNKVIYDGYLLMGKT